MNWTISEQVWQSASTPMWLTLAAVVFIALVLLATLLRAGRSAANGALAVIALLAVGVAAFATWRVATANAEPQLARGATPGTSSLAALACIDDLAGDIVGAGCEKVLFGSPDVAAAAVVYASAQIARLTAHGDVASANRASTPDFQAMRRAIERDRYGLVAYVLAVRDRCTPTDCAVFASLTDRNQITTNMVEKTYEGLIARYAPSWTSTPAANPGPGIAMAPAAPTGKPTNAEFPTAASIPPVSIMTPEPPIAPPKSTGATPKAAALPADRQVAAPPAAAKKQAPAKSRPTAAPVQIAPAPPAAASSSTAPSTANE